LRASKLLYRLRQQAPEEYEGKRRKKIVDER